MIYLINHYPNTMKRTCSAVQYQHSHSPLLLGVLALGSNTACLHQIFQSLAPQRLRQHVCQLVHRGDVLDHDIAVSHILPDEVVTIVDVLGSGIVARIVGKSDRPFIFFPDQWSSDFLMTEILWHRTDLQHFLSTQAYSHVLRLCRAQSNRKLILGLENEWFTTSLHHRSRH